MRSHPDVLLVNSEIHHAARNWNGLLSTTEILLREFPKLDFLWVNRSFALHELKRTPEAFDALLPAAAMFPKRWLIRYNLACYCAQLGRLKEARQWLKQAIALADQKEARAMALRDADLKPLWDEIRSGMTNDE